MTNETIQKEYKKALKDFEGTNWNEIESALFYYRWFGEEFLFDIMKEGRENNQRKIYLKYYQKIKGVKLTNIKNDK